MTASPERRASSRVTALRTGIAGIFACAFTVILTAGLAQGDTISRSRPIIELPTTFSIVYPLLATRLTSGYGTRVHPVVKAVRHHRGVDLAAPVGTPIRAIKNGVVVYADPHGAYGNLIVVRHKDGFTSHYGHCDEILVKPGELVPAGRVIGKVGATGRVTGPHLHLEVRRNGEPIDPELLITKLGERAEG